MAAAALNEVVQALQLFMRHQHSNLSPATLRQLRPGLCVEFKGQTPAAAELDPSWTVNGEPGSSLAVLLRAPPPHSPAGTSAPPLQLLCRRIGDFATLMCYQTGRLGGGGGGGGGQTVPVISESIVARPSDFEHGNLQLTILLSESADKVILDARDLAMQIHLLHLINPELCYKISVQHPSIEDFCVTYQPSICKAVSVCYKLAISLHHYMDSSLLPVRQTKLHLLKGDTHSLPLSFLPAPSPSSLSLYCMAAISPHLPLRRGRKIPADKVCSSLRIYVFGPCHLPLFPACSQTTFPLSTLADWATYGLAVRQSLAQPANMDPAEAAPVQPSLLYDITSTRPPPNASRPSSVKARHALHLFVFMELPDQRQGSGGTPEWRSGLELQQQLRQGFQGLVVEQCKKFQRAAHSALNKLICNYGSHAKACGVMGGVVPLLSEAVASIVSHSTSEQFRSTATEILQVSGVGDVESSVAGQLWALAQSKLYLSHPSESTPRAPNEPTTPEIMEAATDQGRQNGHTATGAAEQPPTATSSQHQSTPAGDTTVATPHCSQEDDTEAPTAASQSLFTARVWSHGTASQRVTPSSSTVDPLPKSGFTLVASNQSTSCLSLLADGSAPSKAELSSSDIAGSANKENSRECERNDDCFDALSDITALDSEFSAPLLTHRTELSTHNETDTANDGANSSNCLSETQLSEFDELGMQEASFDLTPPSPALLPRPQPTLSFALLPRPLPSLNQQTPKLPLIHETVTTECSDLTMGVQYAESERTMGFESERNSEKTMENDLTEVFDSPDKMYSDRTVVFALDGDDGDETMASEAVFPTPGGHGNCPTEQAKAFSDEELCSTDEEWDALSDSSPALVTTLNTAKDAQYKNYPNVYIPSTTCMHTSPLQHSAAQGSDCTRMDNNSFDCLEHFVDSPECKDEGGTTGDGIMELDATDLEWEQSDLEWNQDENEVADSVSICDDVTEQDFHWE